MSVTINDYRGGGSRPITELRKGCFFTAVFSWESDTHKPGLYRFCGLDSEKEAVAFNIHSGELHRVKNLKPLYAVEVEIEAKILANKWALKATP